MQMPSSMELIVFFSYFIVMAASLSLEESKRKQESRTRVPESSMRYSRTIYWFRDYWSNRRGLKRNRQDEDSEIDTGSRAVGDLVLEERDDGRCNVRGERFKNLVNPYHLVRQYEPVDIVVRDVQGLSVYKLPESWEELGAPQEIPRLRRFLRLGPEDIPKPEEVYAEPLVEEKVRPSELIINLAVMTFLIWLTSIVLRYLISFLPWAESTYTPIMLLTSLVYVSLMALAVIEAATRKLREANATVYLFDGKQPDKHYKYAGDVPVWLERKVYWVLRYLFQWPGELTINGDLPFIHVKMPDWERIDVWLDANTGTVEWMVSDYHWRELWYKAEPTLRAIRAWIFPNFHTPRPLSIELEGKGELIDLYTPHPFRQTWKYHRLKHGLLIHPTDWVAAKIKKSALSPIVKELSRLWWDKWRYPLGADSKLYRDNQPAAGDQPPSFDVLGVVASRLDWKKGIYLVKCQDGHERECEVGDKTLLTGNAVCVSPCLTQADTRGDIFLSYTNVETELLRKEGLLTI